MNRDIFGGNAEKSTFNNNSSSRNISGCEIFKVVQEILMQGGIPDGEAKAEANLIVTEISGLRIEEILAGRKEAGNIDASESAKTGVFSDDTIEKIIDIAKRRAETKAPIQHILGFAYFMGDKFYVDKNVLIPRPETELLVQATTKVIREKTASEISPDTINVLDIGTGTGCIPIAISKTLPDVPMELMGVDISTDALRIAIKNMEALGQQRRVIFRKSDIFSGLRPIDKFDIIVSNPPYIPISAKETLQDEVKNFDPPSALFANDEFGVEFYEKILTDAKMHLKACTVQNQPVKNPAAHNNSAKNSAANQKRGYILFELGFTDNVSQADLVSKMALQKGYNIEFIEKDLTGIERVICIST